MQHWALEKLKADSAKDQRRLSRFTLEWIRTSFREANDLKALYLRSLENFPADTLQN